MDRASVRLVQSKLRDLGHYKGKIDGLRGPKTHAAVRKGIPELTGTPPSGWTSWSGKRQSITFLQMYCHAEGINAGRVDGWWGPQTAWAADALEEKMSTGAILEWRDIEPIDANPHRWPRQRDMTAFYGPHGKANFGPTPPPPLVRIPCPWPLRIAWNKSQTRRHFLMHEKVADSLATVLQEIDETYSQQEIRQLGFDLFGGDYNARKMRGGSKWSTHSWGIAIDFDPERNQLKWSRNRASLAHPDCNKFWEAWEKQGWVSLGRLKNFDWMHVQAARL